MWVGSNSDTFSDKKSHERLRGLSLAFAAAFGMIILRLFFLQVVKGGNLAQASENNRTQVIFLRAPRGDFYDRKGRVLVMNRPSWALMYSVPDGSKMKMGDVEERLRPFLESFPKYWTRRLQVAFETKKMVRLADDVPDRVAFVMREMGELVPGLRVVMEFRRGYPMGVFAAHLVGYLGEVNERELHPDPNNPTQQPQRKAGDLVGKIGLEKIQDERLRGTDGGMLIEVDSVGKLKRVIRELPFQKGNSIQLTLDADIQRAAEEELAKTTTKRGAAVALDIKTGAVLAWASAPSFDPLGSMAENLTDPNRPFFDRVYKGTYPPGSVFKIITAIAGLEKDAINTSDKIECIGYVTLPDKGKSDRKFKCWKRHGWVDFWKAVAESCDSYFYLLGKKLGPQTMYAVAIQFGLGQQVQKMLSGESSGNIPNVAWKKKVGLGGWSMGDTLNMSIGQGYITVTPLQMAVMIAGVGSRGQMFSPYVVDKILDANGVPVSKTQPSLMRTVQLRSETWDTIQDALKGVVTEGTGSGINMPYLNVSGKTGTAQNPHGEDHAWFAAFAGYPNEEPSIAVCVFVENGGHGGVAAVPIAKRMLEVAMPPPPPHAAAPRIGGPRV